ncbi:hypothetical protein HanPSC8_Chr01g0042061 [Helianthus annuus]|nr:hypothetical protein HanPSC8_Chr01g0042061 [Helianthus annuus]
MFGPLLQMSLDSTSVSFLCITCLVILSLSTLTNTLLYLSSLFLFNEIRTKRVIQRFHLFSGRGQRILGCDWQRGLQRTTRAQHERHENSQLRNENEKLRMENIRYKEALTNATCPNCGGLATFGEMSFDEQHLRIENARLREED